MSANVKVHSSISSNYELKNDELPSVSKPRNYVTANALSLDAARVYQQHVPASKFGLEIIFGASCAVGAL